MLALVVLVNVRNATVRPEPFPSVHPPKEGRQMLVPDHDPVLKLFGIRLARTSDSPPGMSPAPSRTLACPRAPVVLSSLNGKPKVEPDMVARPAVPKARSAKFVPAMRMPKLNTPVLNARYPFPNWFRTLPFQTA